MSFFGYCCFIYCWLVNSYSEIQHITREYHKLMSFVDRFFVVVFVFDARKCKWLTFTFKYNNEKKIPYYLLKPQLDVNELMMIVIIIMRIIKTKQKISKNTIVKPRVFYEEWNF